MAAKSFVRRARRAAAENELPFWKRKTLAQMTQQEWESLCDGCGMCCTNKLEYEGTGEIVQTDTCCKLLDPKTALCKDYKNRKKLVADCVTLDRRNLGSLDWLPETCSYRLRANGEPLPDWHYLISGSRESVHEAGQSTRGWTVSEDDAGDLEYHVVERAL